MKSLMFLLSLLSIMLFNSCGPTQYASSSNAMYDQSDIYDNNWYLVELNGTPITMTADRHSYLTFSPSGNQITGYTSCNQLGGTFSFSGTDGISFSPRVTTKNTCAGNSIDASFVPALQGVNRWAMVNDDLVMYKNGNIVARFSPSDYSEDDLYGDWQLSYIDNDDNVAFTTLYPEDHIPTLTFRDNATAISGSTGYNTLSCPLTISGVGLTFGACTSNMTTDSRMGETLFLNNLKNINHYTLTNDNTLVLVTDDNRIMRFTRK